MTKQDLLAHLPYLHSLAQAKCRDITEADDLVSETVLAALAFLHRGGEITHPRTWLANTLMHKYNDALRRKYRMPTLTPDAMAEYGEEDDYASLRSDEAEEVRRETAYLTAAYREVLIRHYFRGQSVSRIAAELGIPAGTVKSRLSAGRLQIKRRIEMEEKHESSAMPMTLHLVNSGSQGRHHEPVSLVEGELIAQNLLIHAYEKPLSAEELARRIGIPTVYIEPILRKLHEGELMIRTDGGKYATDFIIYKPEDSIRALQPQLDFVRGHFGAIWSVMETMLDAVREMPEVREMTERVRTKLERYAILESLQQFELYRNGVPEGFRFTHKKRPDGGAWTAFAFMYPMGYSSSESDEVRMYSVCGGRRTNGGKCDYEGAKYLRMYEFDTNLWDSPSRFFGCGFDAYFDAMHLLLWCTHKGIEPKISLPDALMKSIPQYCELGVLTKEDGALKPAVPILTREAFARFSAIIREAIDALDRAVGADFRVFLVGQALQLPRHLSHVQMPYRIKCATQCFVMGVVREAYDRGLHLKDVDYCCPPMILEYE